METRPHQTIDALAQPAEVNERPDVSWGGIFCGTFLVLGLQFLFTLLGSAIGFSAFKGASTGEAIGTGIYFFVTMLVSFYFGGYVASRFAGPRYRINAVLHGVAVWAIIAALTAFAVGSSMKSLIGGTINMAGQVAQSGVDITMIAPQTGATQKPGVKAAPGLSPEQKQQLQQQAHQAAGAARKAVAGGTWYLFVTFLLGLVAASLGGSFGGSYFYRKARST